jgi:subfamily B ATP-binding cassette protein MsbA
MTRPSVTLRRLLYPYWRLLLFAFVAILGKAAADLMEPWPLKIVLDYVVGSKTPPAWLTAWRGADDVRLGALDVAAAMVIGIALLAAVGSYTEKYLSTTVGKRVGYDLRHALYHHVQRLSLSFYEHRRTGDLIVRLTGDIEAVEGFVAGMVAMALDLATLTGMLAIMFYLDWRFSLIALSVTPLLFVISYRFMRRIKVTTRDVRANESEIASIVQETITAARVVKAFAREDFEEHRLDRQGLAHVEASLRARSVKARLTPAIDLVVAAATCVVLYVGARLVMSGTLTAGALVIYVVYLGRMYKPVKELSKTTDIFSKAAVALERIGEIFSVERQVSDRPGARRAHRFAGRIVFDGVAFGYQPDRLVLKDVNLTVEAGQRVALVGATGCGKSTLIALIPRLYDVVRGQVRIDDADVRDYTLQSLRAQVSFVLQDPLLFRATIAENIAYGKPGTTRAEVIAASTLAHAHEFIARMPLGYDTVVGERGDTLSGGQRQRIAIARALVRNTPILLLDEPSAALDAESEEAIFAGLTRLLEGRTSITIAHRLATVREADLIFVLDEGRIAEAGTHEELLGNAGLYARLHWIQLKSGQVRPRSATA